MFRFVPAKHTDLQDWLATPRARLFLQYEQRLLRALLPRLTGYRCLQIGAWGLDACLLEHAGTLCHWRLGLDGERGVDVSFDGLHLPLASASVDALVIAHGLEQVAQPHALLRECARVLNERGQVIVLAFNPLSWSVLASVWPSPRNRRFTPRSIPPSASRLCDWLRLLELEPEELWRYGLGFPCFGRAYCVGDSAAWTRSIAWSAQAYALVARRYVAPRTRLVERRRHRRQAGAAALARSSVRRVKCRR